MVLTLSWEVLSTKHMACRCDPSCQRIALASRWDQTEQPGGGGEFLGGH